MAAVLPLRQASPHTVVSQQLADLASIYQAETQLCVIQRQPSPELAGFVAAALQNASTISVLSVLHPARFDFEQLLPKLAGYPGYLAFCDDSQQLATAFADLFGLAQLGLRLRSLDQAMCPRFHVDNVPCRLIVSYGGLGTEWLEHRHVDRSKLGRGAQGLPDETSGLLRPGAAIACLAPYAIGLMKGCGWAGNERYGLVHRSPKPTSHAPRRLLLTLDFA